MADAKSLDEALLALQEEIPSFHRSADGQVGTRSYKYVTLDDLLDDLNPRLRAHKLLWRVFPCCGPHGDPAIRYRMTHVPSGGFEEDVMSLQSAKASPQDQGSAITYARRYALVAYLNIVIDADDDGKAAQEAAKSATLPKQRQAGTSRPQTTEVTSPPTEDQSIVLNQMVAEHTAKIKKHPAEWKKVEAWAKERRISLGSPAADKLRSLERALRAKVDALEVAAAAKK